MDPFVMESAELAIEALKTLANPDRADVSRRFFKTGPGEYSEGDEFLGVSVPAVRTLSRALRTMTLDALVELLRSRYHEARLLALLAMVDRYKRGDESTREDVYRAYLANTDQVNNWDLVDSSAEHIVGGHLWQRDRKLLGHWAVSQSMWERRIAVLATFHFIRKGEYDDTLDVAEKLLRDREDLIHKAVGWMLREIGKRDRAVLDEFLGRHYTQMPRTMLRYAIEKHDPHERQRYLRGEM
jgi:3-methyladenine DNA glycosylase AlkD